MLHVIFKIIRYLLSFLLALIIVALVYFNWPVKTPDKKFDLGVTFSYRYAQDIGLDWKENFSAILDELKVRNIRIPAYWDRIEKKEGEYDFSDLDWQINEAQKRSAKIILVVGQKVPRWPECFIPAWAQNDDAKRKTALLQMIAKTVQRYKNNETVTTWQVENEPFLKFGICPKLDVALLDREIETVRKLDDTRPIMLTDSGELSLWIEPAKRADIFGTTMYFTVYSEKAGYFKYPIGPNFFKFKHWLIRKFAGQEEVVIIELQAEPWIDEWTVHASLEKQLKSMNAQLIGKNVEFAKKTGFSEIYLWGAEWWWWLKEKQEYPEVWNEAREIFAQ